MNASSSTILIVDDNPLGREVLGDVLESDGYKLYYASDGPEALSLAADLDPDLILLDVMMPDMDGYEVCRRLRADNKLCEVPVLMVSALDDRLARIKGIEVGADDFVCKPVDRMELRARVRTINRLNRYRKLQEQQKLRERVEDEREELRTQLYRAKHLE
jgi:putative two-component system response regulator